MTAPWLAAIQSAMLMLVPSASLAQVPTASAASHKQADAARSPAETRCVKESELAAEYPIKKRFSGKEAFVFIRSLEPSFELEAPYQEKFFVVVVDGVAFAGTDDCVSLGPKFLEEIVYINALQMVDRARAGKSVTLPDLEIEAAKGDADAQLHLGILQEVALHREEGLALLAAAAKKNVPLAMLAFGHYISGIGQAVLLAKGSEPDWFMKDMVPVGDEMPPTQFQYRVPQMNRPLGYCWLKAAEASKSQEVARLASSDLEQIWERMTTSERRSGTALWERSNSISHVLTCEQTK